MRFLLVFLISFPNLLFGHAYCVDAIKNNSLSGFEIIFSKNKSLYKLKFTDDYKDGGKLVYLDLLDNENQTAIFSKDQYSYNFEGDKLVIRDKVLKRELALYKVSFFPKFELYNLGVKQRIKSYNLTEIVPNSTSFNYCIQNTADEKLNLWKIKGEFEKTKDYELRNTTENQKNARNEFLVEIENELLKEYEKKFNRLEIKLGDYDADNEFFILKYPGLDNINFPVPIDKAPYFKENFSNKNFSNVLLSFYESKLTIKEIEYKSRKEDLKYRNRKIGSKTFISECYNGNCNEGNGSYRWSSGNEYSGEWLDGKMHGFGTYTWHDDDLRESYIGEFLEGKFHGKGIILFKNGKKTEGIWTDGNGPSQ